MARIPYFDPDDAPDNVVRALAGKRKINIFRMVANSENCTPEVLALGHTLSKGSSLDPVHREVVILRVAHLTKAAYMWHEHTAVAQRAGLTLEKIHAVAAYGARDAAPDFTAFERTLLDVTDSVVATTTVDDELFEAVRGQYDDSRLVELVLLIGFYMMVARVMNTFEVEPQTEAVDSYRLHLS